MTDRDALLAAVCAAPDDDLPRLVFADWLDEHGDPDRAEFIRAAEVEQEAADERGRRWRELEGRAAELLARHGTVWAAEAGGVGLRPTFRRGFLDGLTLAPRRFAADGAALLSRVPLRRVRFGFWETPLGMRAADLFAVPHLGRLAGIDLRLVRVTDADVTALAGSAHLAGLRSLVLTAGGVSATAAAGLLTSPGLPALSEWTMHAAGDDLVGALVREPAFARVRRLALWESNVTAAAGLADSPHVAGLEHLEVGSMGGGRLGATGTAALAASPHLAGLRTLRLSSQGVGLAGVRAVAASLYLAGLRRLGLTGDPFTRSMIDALVASVTLDDLRGLEVPASSVSEADADRLRERFPAATVVRS